MILLYIALLSAPIDALHLRARCVEQRQMLTLVERCDELLRSRSRSTLGTRTEGPDARTLGRVLGEPTRADGWLRFPRALKASTGQCRVSIQPSELGSWALRLAVTREAGLRVTADPQCPRATDLEVLMAACRSAWPEELDLSLFIGERDAWSPRPGVHFEQRPYGLHARFKDSRIGPEQLEPVFGPGTGPAHRRAYRAPPPVTATGRRCVADARFVGGRLEMLDVYRASQWRGPAAPGTDALSPAARAQLRAIEAACLRGPAEDVFPAKDGESVGSWLGLDTRSVRLVDLLLSYGSGEMVRHRRDLDEVVVWDARYTFELPSGRCRLEVEVLDPIEPAPRARLRWR